jgi:osmoprotectant transport system substrate-binding protein
LAAFKLKLLDDSRGALPPCDALLLVRNDASDALRRALARLDGAIDGEAMRAANRLVDLDGRTLEEASRRLVETVRATANP